MKSASDRITKARAQLVMHHPFFGYHALSMPVTEMPSIETMATDGSSMFYNTSFVDKLSDEGLLAVVAHEVLHRTNGHHLRRDERDPYEWNVACDYAINPMLVASGFKLPKGALLSAKYNLDWSAERIYQGRKKTRESQPKNGPRPKSQGEQGAGNSGRGQDPGGMGGVMDAKNPDGSALTQAEKRAAAAELATQVAQSVMAAKGQGSNTLAADWHMKTIRNSALDWRDLLRRHIKTTVNGQTTDYSMSKPSRRFIYQGIYMPGAIKSAHSDIVVVIDTSGSVDEALVGRFMGEVNGIASECLPENLHVICCSNIIHSHDVFQYGDVADAKVVRGGGTDFRPAFKLIEDKGVDPACMVYLTDTDGCFPASAPHYPVYWATETKNPTVPWGEVININLAVHR
ncbi:MAG: hypothetical protein JW395_3341 [Nitrospira sp.]|nr:hypothetical protein [Nitrospira sp.]